MTGQCCTGEGRSRPLARRLSGSVASMLPGAVLVLLPKCPLCLAAWLTVATGGIAISAASAERIRWIVAAFWAVSMLIAVGRMVRRRALGDHASRGLR